MTERGEWSEKVTSLEIKATDCRSVRENEKHKNIRQQLHFRSLACTFF